MGSTTRKSKTPTTVSAARDKSDVVNTFNSTFPGLWKYTATRNKIYPDAFDWLAEKRKDDDCGELWRVHDKLYNLEHFIDRHPGGSDFIDNSRGTDITEAFEASHIVNFSNTEKILEKYYVKDATSPRNSPFTFRLDGFYKTLKQRVEPVLKKVGTGPTLQVKIYQDLLLVSFLALSLTAASSGSLALLVAAGTLLNFVLSSAHNFAHIKDNWRKYYMDVALMSSHEWRVTHGLSHHMYPNTLLDWEVSVLEPFLVFLPTESKSWFQRYAIFVYQYLVYFGGFGPAYAKRLGMIALGYRKFRLETVIPLVELAVWSWLASGLSQGFICWLIIHGTCSTLFMLIGFIAGHHHPASTHDGDEARTESDFGLCQLDATIDKDEKLLSSNLWITLLSFGDHPQHHLFPAVCHSKLHYLRPVIEATLKDFKESWVSLPQWQLFTGLNQQYKRNQPVSRSERWGLIESS